MAYSEYPKCMSHPQAQAAVLSQDIVNRDGSITKAAPGKPAKFPQIFVNNRDQELEAASRGYIPNGTSDPEAYMRSVVGADTPAVYGFQEFPKWLYQADEDAETGVRGILVESKEHQDKLQGVWYATPDDAVLGAETEPDDGLAESIDAPARRGRPRKDA